MTVADLGCGVGFYTFPLVEAVGPTGQVLALDIEPSAIEAVQARAEDLHRGALHNLQARLTTPDDPGIEPASVDMVLMAHLDILMAEALQPETEQMMQRLALSLTPGGTLVVLQWYRPGARVDLVVNNVQRYGLSYETLHELHYPYVEPNTATAQDHTSFMMIFRKPPG